MTASKKSNINIGCADPSNPSDTRPTCLNLSSEIRSQAKILGEMQHKSMSSVIEEGMRSYFSQ